MQNVLPSTEKAARGAQRRFADALRVAGLVGLLAVLGGLSGPVGQAVYPTSGRGAELNGAGWEARRLVAQMLWVKTHAVLHAGVEEREALPGEQISRSGEVHRHDGGGQSSPLPAGIAAPGKPAAKPQTGGRNQEEHFEGDGHDHGDGHGHKGAYVLVIPPANEDFRGPLGDLERNVKPYLSAKGAMYSKDSDQTLAFYRLITWLDPHHIQGYVIGSSFMSRAGEFADDGLRFLHEGERNNPDSFEIQTELGHFYLVYKHDYPAAAKHLELALQLIPRHRPLLEVEEDARADVYRWLALTYQESKQPEKAVQIARAGLQLLEHDGTLEHVLARKGMPLK